MNEHMPSEITTSRKVLRANFTRKWFLARMDLHVLGHIFSNNKLFQAHFT